MDFETAKQKIGEARMSEILDKLEEPFDPELIYWKPQATNGDKTRAMAAAYADPRAYSDRLNEVVGPSGWKVSYNVFTMDPIPNPAAKNKYDAFLFKGKVLVVASLVIEGVGQNSGTGESDAVDENAITSAEAQAFKRAAIRFGLGRYLYNLPKGQWAPYDKESRRITTPPELPGWAIPKKVCEDCREKIEPFQHGERVISVTELITNSQRKYQKQLCAGCQKARVHAAAPQAPANIAVKKGG